MTMFKNNNNNNRLEKKDFMNFIISSRSNKNKGLTLFQKKAFKLKKIINEEIVQNLDQNDIKKFKKNLKKKEVKIIIKELKNEFKKEEEEEKKIRKIKRIQIEEETDQQRFKRLELKIKKDTEDLKKKIDQKKLKVEKQIEEKKLKALNNKNKTKKQIIIEKETEQQLKNVKIKKKILKNTLRERVRETIKKKNPLFLKFYGQTVFKSPEKEYVNFLIFKTLVGKLTKKGKKLAAFNLVFTILLNFRKNFFKNTNEEKVVFEKEKVLINSIIDGAEGFFKGIRFILPLIRIAKRRISATYYYLPSPLLNAKNSIAKALKNILTNSFKRKEKTLALKISNEVVQTIKKTSESFKQKQAEYLIGTRGIPFLRYLLKRRPRERFTQKKALKFRLTRDLHTYALNENEEQNNNLLKDVDNYLIKDEIFLKRFAKENFQKKKYMFYKVQNSINYEQNNKEKKRNFFLKITKFKLTISKFKIVKKLKLELLRLKKLEELNKILIEKDFIFFEKLLDMVKN